MDSGNSTQPGLWWLAFAAMTFVAWGLYGPLLHSGAMAMRDPVNGRFKAFLFVGVAYFLVAVLAPVALLLFNRAEWTFEAEGWKRSLVAGALGAAGAFTLLLAFGAGGMPNVVMSIVFAGAPIVTAAYILLKYPPEKGLAGLPWQFFLGIVLATTGGCLVALYRPEPPKAKPAPAVTATVQAPAAE